MRRADRHQRRARRAEDAGAGTTAPLRACLDLLTHAGKLLWVLALLMGTSAPAAGLTLTWSAPPPCPSRDEVLRDLAQLDPVVPAMQAVVRARVVEESRQQWSAHLEIEAGNAIGERVLHAETCELVARASALVIVLALHPDGALVPASEPALPPIPPPPPIPPLPPVPPPPPPAVKPSAPSVAPEERQWRVLVEPLAAFEAGLLPNPDLAFGASIGLRQGRLRGELAATTASSQTFLVLGAPEQARLTLQIPILSRARGCAGGRFGRVSVDGCAGVEGAELHGQSSGIAAPAAGGALWLGVFAGAGVGVQVIGPLSLRCQLEGGLSPVRPSFTLDPAGDLYRPPLLYGRVSLGLEVEL